MPLKNGYSRPTVAANIAMLEREGKPRNTAIRLAFDHGRKSYFDAHPQGALPEWLAYPKQYRLRAHYSASGSPVSRNPVRELDIPKAELAKIQHAVDREFAGRGAGLRKAAALYTKFTGHKDVDITKVLVPALPKELVEIGKVDGILYSTVRDGIAEKYIHKFKSKARPLFAVSPDGLSLYLLGGAFKFGERGIVDDD